MKSLDSFVFTAMLELARCAFITRRENVIAVGNSGTGKTHVGLALGLAACQKGFSTLFITAHALAHPESRQSRSATARSANLTK